MAPSRWSAVALAATTLTLAPLAATGQTNTFESGTTEGWLIHLLGPAAPLGGPPAAALPTNVATGGPAGLNDNFLRLNSLGTPGPGGRLMVLNPGGWAGNYLAAGITSIRLDARNFGNTDVFLRFLVEDAMNAPPTNVAISAVPVVLAAGGGWQSIEFPLFGASGLTAVMGSVAAALGTTTIVRIFSSETLTAEPAPLAATVGLDNITAVSTVPEPSTAVLLGTGALGLLLARRRRPPR
jgi:hypothetical protein